MNSKTLFRTKAPAAFHSITFHQRCLRLNQALCAAGIILATASVVAQPGGTINFGNHSSSLVTNGLTSQPAAAADNVKAALYWAPLGSDTFVQLGDAAPVGTPLPGLFAGGTRTTGSAAPGGSDAKFQVRAWGGGFTTYEEALLHAGVLIGQSAIITRRTGNPLASPPSPPGSLISVNDGGLSGFTLTPNGNGGLPPVIICSSNKMVECGSAWTFDPPAALDSSGGTNVVVTVLSTVTNRIGHCGGTFTATRTWQAVDLFTNTASCSQTVMVVDTTPPIIVCPASLTVEAQNGNGAVVPFVVTASDTCSAVSLWATPPPGSLFPIGVTPVQATAMDSCSNVSQCTFTATVLGALGVKSNVLAELIALRTSAPMTDSFATKFDYVILHLQNSLNPSYWIDQTHLTPDGGNIALNEEKLAANMLDVIMSSSKCPVAPAILQGFINRILKSDRLLAMVSINEAISAGLNAKKIAEDLAEVGKGDEEAAAGRYANAIEHYRNALRHAIQLQLRISQNVQGGTQVRFIGINGKSYLMEVSEDLVHWVPLGTRKTDAEGNVTFTDAAAGRAQRFYRAIEQ